jgi:hypothetical protein
MGRKIKVGTNVQILFRPLKKVFLKRGWDTLYEKLKEAKGDKRKLILFVAEVPPKGMCFETPTFNKEDGKYYGISFCDMSNGWDNSCNIPTSCFKVVEGKKK